ncbi:PmbA protein [Parabacteroides sp. PF5-5]|uniref:TldD/PmbA family protein n=1 Tax=unclassified Parabacteroides TaxID=2649774 RepID=UPI002476A8CF|nr:MULTISPECIES: TldD/PmbA family protein [unclassified Parabacteroides]MDH6305817.1 PmbA protein [Parabacteroides sp. PH5-39]MDH6317369.1 PmbA protein [Parabacteroides sp. PF5-13]MDH6320577.1 PmbA protein [Parabacteroides sp. PH5-13]MDH6324260.1 PmbA protein [Parabacteroides sp. PH5-8]MDH6328457.1 PmbA protein [Parabacteroides sp. PH5-41]
MITNDNKALAQWAMEYALKNGCQASRVGLYKGTNSSFEIRDMKTDRLTQASESSLVIHLFVDGRYGSFSTNRLEKKELEKFIQNGIDSTRYLAEDLARTLPDPSLYYKGGGKDLQLLDTRFDAIQPDSKKDLAMKVCDEIMGKDPRIISSTSSYGDERNASYMIASNGFEGERASSSFTLVGSVSIKGEGEARPESYWYDSSIFYDALIKEGIGKKALERVIRKLGQKKIASGKYTMVVDNMNSARLISPILGAIYGSSIQQKNSFLLDKLNQKVIGDNVTIIDEPHMAKKQGARYFDGEGVATKRLPVFENGVLKTYYIDIYNANKLGTTPTISGPSILTMQMGSKNESGLIASVEKGILVTGFNGGNSNSSTGDFSYGVEGFLIENGKLTQPVSEMNITGNMLTLWSNLKEIGNDVRESSSWRIPSLAFEEVDFSGL